MPNPFLSRPTRRLFLGAGATCGLAACASLPRAPFTRGEQRIATIPGIPDARVWSDAPLSAFVEVIGGSLARNERPRPGPTDVLALSGGGVNGAYGAGILNGWTLSGRRPEAFDTVSGVSTGALIAPLAFLGPAFDQALEAAYTSGAAEALVPDDDNILTALVSGAASRRARLRGLIARFLTAEVLALIAQAHREGRRLLIVTTNLDAQRSVVWNVGAIAASGQPGALDLARDILTASASIPGLFAPTLITAEAGGRLIQEMHVDGGATTQVFVVPDALLSGAGLGARRRGGAVRLFVVVNNRLAPEFEVVENGTLPVVGRAFATVIKSHARSTLAATQAFARRNGISFNLTAIGESFPEEEGVGPGYGKRLFEHAVRKASQGDFWEPGLPVAARAVAVR